MILLKEAESSISQDVFARGAPAPRVERSAIDQGPGADQAYIQAALNCPHLRIRRKCERIHARCYYSKVVISFSTSPTLLPTSHWLPRSCLAFDSSTS